MSTPKLFDASFSSWSHKLASAATHSGYFTISFFLLCPMFKFFRNHLLELMKVLSYKINLIKLIQYL